MKSLESFQMCSKIPTRDTNHNLLHISHLIDNLHSEKGLGVAGGLSDVTVDKTISAPESRGWLLGRGNLEGPGGNSA